MKSVINKIRHTGYFIISLSKQIGMRSWVDTISMMFHMIAPIWGGDIDKNYKRRHALNLKFLRDNLVLSKEIPVSQPIASDNYRVWVLWWQGEDAMPDIVRIAVNSIRRAVAKELIIITKDNINQYLDIPVFILDKVNEGIIKLAALSDYIRVSLLVRYGGLWIDSTVFFAQSIPAYVYEKKLFSIKNKTDSDRFVARGKWNVQFLGTCEKNNRVFYLMKNLFEQYWKKYDTLIDYLLVDYCFEYIYESDPISKAMFDAIPYTNANMHVLRAMMNDKYDKYKFAKLTEDGTYLFKLTYKMNLIKEIDGVDTFFGHLLKEM